MSRILHRRLDHVPPVAIGGEGAFLIAADGRRYLDASGGAAVSCLGHGHPAVTQAIRRQAEKLSFAHSGFFTSEPAEALADRLIADAPPGLEAVFLCAGGSEAMEAALKLARQYFVEIGAPQRTRFIARRQSYHGNTLGALAVGGNAARRATYAPLLVEAHHVAPCYAYRDQAEGETDDAYADRLAAELEATLQRLGPETVIGFVAETVSGATLGAVPPVPGYFRRIREVCDRHGVLLILDEVMCGMGRTGTLHACMAEGVAPDLMTIAKGLGGGYQPVGAMLVSGRIREALAAGSGGFQHGHTYLAHPIACAAALAVQEVIAAENLLDAVRRQGAALADRLHARFGQHPQVGDIRGRGLFQALELVADRATQAPFPPERTVHARLKREAFARGLCVYPMGGTADGRAGDHVLLAPPFTITDSELDLLVDRLSEALAAALA